MSMVSSMTNYGNGRYSARLHVNADEEKREITVEVDAYGSGEPVHEVYPADKFGEALDRYKELSDEAKRRWEAEEDLNRRIAAGESIESLEKSGLLKAAGSEADVPHKFVATLSFYEKNCFGEFSSGDPCIYQIEGDSREAVASYENVIWQAIEVEGFDNTEVFVEVEVEKNGEYFDRDEFVLETEVKRTSSPSRFVKWGDKEPHIFEIDRAASSFRIVPV